MKNKYQLKGSGRDEKEDKVPHLRPMDISITKYLPTNLPLAL